VDNAKKCMTVTHVLGESVLSVCKYGCISGLCHISRISLTHLHKIVSEEIARDHGEMQLILVVNRWQLNGRFGSNINFNRLAWSSRNMDS
jgi:hypothetical protein